MGSWSEACGFSGMEIGEGEVAYCLLMEVPDLFFLFPDWEEADRLGVAFWMVPSIQPKENEPKCPACGSALRKTLEALYKCRSIYCDWEEAPRPVRTSPIWPVPPEPPKTLERTHVDGRVERVSLPPAPRQRRAVAGSQVQPDDDWKQGLGPKVRETKQVNYKIGVGDAHHPVLQLMASSDEEAEAKAKKEMKRRLNKGEVKEPRMGWVFHILERSS